jgi:hypothetical protein
VEQQYKIALKLNDFGFELESTDKKWVEDKEKEYLERFCSHESKKGKASKTEELTIPKETMVNLSINEFYKKYVKASNITSRPDIAVFFVYYLQKIQKTIEIKSGNITECFKDISYPGYNTINYTDILNQGFFE